MTIQLRQECAEDDGFLRRLIMQTIALELGADQWPDLIRSQLIGLQYQNRRMGPRVGFPAGDSRVIEVDGAPAGWIYGVHTGSGYHIVEVMVTPEMRGRGIGTAAIEQVMEMARREGIGVTSRSTCLTVAPSASIRDLGFAA